MKKIICLLSLMLIVTGEGAAKEKNLTFKQNKVTFKQNNATPAKILQSYDRFEVFQLGIWYKFPQYTWNSSVYGLKFGFPISAGIGKVKGVELAFVGAATEHINGVQMAFGYCNTAELYGIQLSCVNISSAAEAGWQLGMVNNADDAELQLGIVNYAKYGSCQFGLINIIKNGLIPFTILFNYADTAPKSPYQGRK